KQIAGIIAAITENAEASGGATPASVGDQELSEIATLVEAAGYNDRVRIDRTVVRGLEYYTGPVYEVELTFEVKDEKGRPVRFGRGRWPLRRIVVALWGRAGAGDRLLNRRLAPAGRARRSRQNRRDARTWPRARDRI